MISLKSKISQKILNLLFLNENERFYVNELAKNIDEDPSNVYKKLIELKKQNIISDEFSGKERFFFLNKNYPLLKEYKSIVLKGVGFEKNLKEGLEKIEGVDSAYIFGSYARNNLSEESDIDILVVGNFNAVELLEIISKIQKMSGREINVVDFSKKEFDEKLKNKDNLLKDIFSNKYIKII
jgi:predicted nucleotidyltransferase